MNRGLRKTIKPENRPGPGVDFVDSAENWAIIEQARQVIRIETEAVQALEARIDQQFVNAVALIMKSRGRVIVTGMGKSGLVAGKIAATLRSTGTASVFLHPAEAVHGDLGLVLKDDVIICISKSGNTDELTRLFPIFKEIGVSIIAMTGNPKSALARRADVYLDVSVKEEACPYDLAPTASTTAALAMGDALAVALLAQRNFSRENFAFLHPGGNLGRKLTLKIDDIMFTGKYIPRVRPASSIREVILEISSKRFGSTCVVDDDGKLCGIVTDGDLRRLLEQTYEIANLSARDIMNKQPKTIRTGELASIARSLMAQFNIMQVVVVDPDSRPVGMIHLHDLLEAGVDI